MAAISLVADVAQIMNLLVILSLSFPLGVIVVGLNSNGAYYSAQHA